MRTPRKTWPLDGELKGESSEILQSLLSPRLHAQYAIALCQCVLEWLLTFIFRVPLQGIRLSTFFARLALYVVFLFPAMVCGLLYWAFAGKDIISVKYKESGWVFEGPILCMFALRDRESIRFQSGVGGFWLIGILCYFTMCSEQQMSVY